MASRVAHRKHRHIKHKKHRDGFDYVVYFFGVAAPLFELPQVWQIYANHSAQNVSLTTWAFFCLDNFVWAAYALRKKEWPLLITSILYEVIEASIAIGILRYS
jgi:uncharacterized protein with PQ loop repeat